MSWSLYNRFGQRKYLTPEERLRCLNKALDIGGKEGTFCATLILCGARVSEVLAVSMRSIDDGNLTITFETLKRRSRGIFRSVPVPLCLLDQIELSCAYRSKQSHRGDGERVWPWCRTTAWKKTRAIMETCSIPKYLCTPKALRHAFGIAASERSITLGLVGKWMGHAKLESTAIYATPVGQQERALAKRMWH